MNNISNISNISKRHNNIIGPGGVTVITVFVVLCMTIFAVLSLITARTDANNSRKRVAAVENYYTADCEATDKLGDITVITANSSITDLDEALRQNGFGFTVQEDLRIVSYNVDIDENQRICVEISIDSKRQIKILKWKTENKSSFIYEDSLPVWDGETFD